MTADLDDDLLEPSDGEVDRHQPIADAHPNKTTPAEPKNHFSNVYAFVRDFLNAVYARRVTDQDRDFRWCAHWWEHTEAVSRLESLWKAFEALRLDAGTGASVWWRDHADPCMDRLSAPDGPFRGCSNTSHVLLPPLPMVEPPEALLQLSGLD
ncbi:MAG: DUF4913 domain-containing protein [Acidimicrobiales bacterium]|nr:MAG: DUF4913 domain-containing protein [Acidimicrobiales bacterium]